VWLTEGPDVVAKADAQLGVRDAAREGSPAILRQTLNSLIDSLIRQAKQSPSRVLGAGMITSALGLMEIPHVTAPAGASELAAALRRCAFPDVTDLPVFLVPGLRCGPAA